MAWYISLKGLTDVESAIESPLSRVSKLEVDIMFMDVVCEIGGGLGNGNTPMSEESFRRHTPMF